MRRVTLVIAALVVAIIAVAFGSPGATTWILWPLVVVAIVSLAAALLDVGHARRPRAAR